MINKVDEFKNRLNHALEIRNMSPVELSRRTKISESTISQYRSGYAKPKEKKLAIISNALNVNPAWLMGLDVSIEPHKYDSNENYVPIMHLNEEEMQIISNYRFASKDTQKAVCAILGIKKEGD